MRTILHHERFRRFLVDLEQRGVEGVESLLLGAAGLAVEVERHLVGSEQDARVAVLDALQGSHGHLHKVTRHVMASFGGSVSSSHTGNMSLRPKKLWLLGPLVAWPVNNTAWPECEVRNSRKRAMSTHWCLPGAGCPGRRRRPRS